MSANIPKMVNIIEASEPEEQTPSSSAAAPPVATASVEPAVNQTKKSANLERGSSRLRSKYFIKSSEEIGFTPPTFSERLMKFMVVIVYICGLCSLGFFLSIYYIFFWDSRMPPVFKASNKKSVFHKP